MPEARPVFSNELPIGRRVAYWRGRRNMTQQLFADRIGKSKSWVDKVERGARRLDRYSVINDIAGVLRVDVAQLLGNTGSHGGTDARDTGRDGIDHLRAALERYPPADSHPGDDSDAGDPPEGTEPTDLAELGKAVDHAWLSYQHADYQRLAAGLPRLLHDAQVADRRHTGDDDGTRAAHLLAQAYQIASSVLRKLGDPQLARLTADRAVAAAVRAGDPLLVGIAIGRAGNALLALGRVRPAFETHVVAAHHLAPAQHFAADSGGDPADPARLSVVGALLLRGALAAAHLGDPATMHELLQGAERAAEAVGDGHNHYWTSFGPANSHLYRISAAVVLGDGRRALELRDRIVPRALARLVPERRAHLLLDLARAYAQVGDLTAAAETLLDTERLAPAEIRHRPAAREIMIDLLAQATGTPAASVTELAKRMGLPG
ncbi:helix-turn-helix domain-containing protein [Micromonospora sp. NPDC049559]|uniref:helix-turn-helix domain-containing protein n=1 Tax=Micromonospora sp. NPDC049559 TaxID=3155923 RepID=UPI00342215E9